MERKALIAMILSLVIYGVWQSYFPHKPRELTAFTTEQQVPITTETQKITPSNLSSIELKTSISSIQLLEKPPFLKGFHLNDYHLDLQPQSDAVDLNAVLHQDSSFKIAFDDPAFAYLHEVQGQIQLDNTSNASTTTAHWNYEDAQVKWTQTFQSHANLPYLEAHVQLSFKKAAPRYAFVSMRLQEQDNDPEAQDRQYVYWTQTSIERLLPKDIKSLKEIITPIQYLGVTNRYFIFALIAQTPLPSRGLIQPLSESQSQGSLIYPITQGLLNFPLKVYFGPKKLDLLRSIEPTLDHTVDFGWFTLFAYPLLQILNQFYHLFQNYGLAIIALTLLLKIITYPLTYKSMKSMKKMSALQPQLQRIREKYKDDREALNREMLTLMRSQGYNPAAGCLPMIIQMPIFFALYRVLYSSIELYHAPFTLWIQDLSNRDPYYITPVLLSITLFIQQKLTPTTTTDPAQAKMLQWMPLIFGLFMLTLPSGLTLYMLVNAIASIAQQVLLNRKLGHATTARTA